MPRVAQTVVVDEATARSLLAARTSPVVETPVAGGDGAGPDGVRRAAFDLAQGPMLAYRREVEAVPAGDGQVTVSETTTYHLALGIWSWAIVWPTNHGLRRIRDRQTTKTAVWAPPDNLDARAGTVLGLLLTLSLLAGYVGTVLTQTITYAADEFGQDNAAQGAVLAGVRVGVLGALALVALSDRKGRRAILLVSVLLACLATAAGALAPSLAVLGVTQTVARAFATTTTLLLTVVAAEEMPKGARAYAISVMTMTGALGAGMAVWALPLAGWSTQGWRIVFALALLGLPVVRSVHRHLPESQRFVRPHREATVLRGHARRFWAIGAALFGASAFGAPSAQLLNDFLKDERGFTASQISLFIVATSTPAGLALVAGGRLADTRGRRHVVAIGVAGAATVGAWGFTQSGWTMWVANLVATMLGALAVPAMGAYGPELFPTAARAKANGVLQVISVAGSALGLVVASEISDRTGRLADGMFVLLPLALLVAVLALTVFPETARRELEDINPEDDLSVAGAGHVIDPLAADDGALAEWVDPDHLARRDPGPAEGRR